MTARQSLLPKGTAGRMDFAGMGPWFLGGGHGRRLILHICVQYFRIA